MAFPTRDSLQKIWVQLSSRAKSLKTQCTNFNAASLSGPVSASAVEGVFIGMGDFRAYASSVVATEGLAEYVQEQYTDQQINIATEYNAMIAAIDSSLSWMVTNIPQSGGYVQLDQWASNGTITRRTFSTVSLAGLRTIVQSVANTIE
jgi:hypothetical protein